MSATVPQLERLRIVPVIVIDDAAHAERLADALADGGLPCAEVTFRTDAAAESIRRMRARRPDMLIGAGTVLTTKQAALARHAGADFIVSPGFNPAVVDDCQANNIQIFPGICTPTEIEMALGKGLTIVKFFPAEPMGGLNFLKAIAAPYNMVQFIPTGGISTKNIGEYLAFKRVLACGGSWMAPGDWIANGEFARIQEETARAVAAVQAIKGAA
jgi:2-dehydro-3-deoxyphosphogluconate aldolase/(4S)-4-hydroxy-2-oxoglutarate aldolase